jgi:DNA polymerase epsilon subunit 3
MQLGDLVGPLQDELPSESDHNTMTINLTWFSEYREIQKSGRKSTGARSKPSASTAATDPSGSMGPPQSIPKKGKGAAVVVPMSEDEDGHAQGQISEANMDVDAEMDVAENDDDADANESQGEEEGEEDEEEEEEELVDQMAVEDEEVRQDTQGLDIHGQPVDGDGGA